MNANPDDWAPVEVAPHRDHDHEAQLLQAVLQHSPMREPPQPQPQPQPAYDSADPAGPHSVPAAVASPPKPLAGATLADHRARISAAARIPEGSARDAALISALRGVSAALESAEEDHARASDHLAAAKGLFNWAAGELSGYAGAEEPERTAEGPGGVLGAASRKRGRPRKGEEVSDESGLANYGGFAPPDEGALVPPPPAEAAGGSGMTEEHIVAHRDAFYQKLCGVPYTELGSFTPPSHLVNLKSRAQLDEYVFIVAHWDNGTDTMDVMEFRRRHKSFYTKVKMSKENIGRRTGHHLRDLAGGNGRRKAFCRYGKRDESLMYVPLEELYDAIFEIHCLGGHRAWHACKKIANLKYANIPQDQIKRFVDTCPVCSLKRAKRMKTELEEEMIV